MIQGVDIHTLKPIYYHFCLVDWCVVLLELRVADSLVDSVNNWEQVFFEQLQISRRITRASNDRYEWAVIRSPKTTPNHQRSTFSLPFWIDIVLGPPLPWCSIYPRRISHTYVSDTQAAAYYEDFCLLTVYFYFMSFFYFWSYLIIYLIWSV